jgi:hypothetical protein
VACIDCWIRCPLFPRQWSGVEIADAKPPPGVAPIPGVAAGPPPGMSLVFLILFSSTHNAVVCLPLLFKLFVCRMSYGVDELNVRFSHDIGQVSI